MARPFGRTSLLVVPATPPRKNSHLVVIVHKGGGWYEAECMGQTRRCRAGKCDHARGLGWSDSDRPIRQVPPRDLDSVLKQTEGP